MHAGRIYTAFNNLVADESTTEYRVIVAKWFLQLRAICKKELTLYNTVCSIALN